jgi:ATP-dependent Clp protease ATP-binding subunit ClpA
MVHAIARKELGEIGHGEGFQRSGLKLIWSERLVAWLAHVGFDSRYGARPLQRVLERQVGAPLAKYLFAHPTLRDTKVQINCSEQGEIRVYGPVC